jgi:ribA/ribD-fused uncharacterized protein
MTIEDYGYVVKNGIIAFQRGPFSNFWGGYKNQGNQPQIKTIWGDFNCNEQYYMWRKAMFFHDSEIAEKIFHEKIPRNQKELGRQVKGFDIERWDFQKPGAMLDGLLHKFGQNEWLKQLLLSTGDLIIAEAADWDLEWGTGYTHLQDECFDRGKWKGKNLLGFSLMEVRENLRS